MNIVETVRVQFSKTGRAKYISHLDLMRTMTRVLRRADIPLWYTEGFSKHPYITFAAPLSLGYEGLCEHMDFRLEQEMAMDEIVKRLNDNMPEGIVVLSAAPAVMKVGDIVSSRWEIRLPSNMYDCIINTLSKDVLEVQKRTKKKTFKTVDIKPAVQDVDIQVDNNQCVLSITLPTGEQAVNPALLLELIFDGEYHDVSITRKMVIAKNGEKFR